MPITPPDPNAETTRKLSTLIETQLHRSDWYENTELQAAHREALNAYFGRTRAPNVNGKSNARSMDVADTVEALTAEILPAFDYSEVGQFPPMNPDDHQQAAVESKICNRYLQVNDHRTELQQAIRNLLLLRGAPAKVFVDKRESVNEQSYKGLSELELLAAQQPTAPNQAVKVVNVADAGEDEDGERLTDITIRRTTVYQKLSIRAVDPTQFITPREYEGHELQDCLMCGERVFYTRSDLVGMGYPREVIDNVPTTQTETRVPALARNRDITPPFWDTTDKSLDRLECFELYVRFDADDDGFAELYRVMYAGGTSNGKILSMEPWPFVPYAWGVAILYPHRLWGVSVFDKLFEIEILKSRGLQQWEENLLNANNAELVVADGEVAMSDVQNRRPGGHIRADRTDAVAPIPVVDTGNSSIRYLSYLDKVRGERAGASLDMHSAQFQIAGESAHGIERQMAAKEVIAQMICRTIGETLIRQVFLLIHRTLKEFMPTAQDFPVGGGQFVTTEPRTWPARGEVEVVAGLSHSERLERRQTMEQVLLQQEKLFTAGEDGVLMDRDTYFAALLDWTKTGGIATPRRYWLDPSEPLQQQTLQAKREAQQQAMAEQQAQNDRLFATQVMIADRDNQADLVKHLTQLRFDYWQRTLTSGTDVATAKIRAGGQVGQAVDEGSSADSQVVSDQETGRSRSAQLLPMRQTANG